MSYETTQSSLTGGTASVGSNGPVQSAYVGTNDDLFPDVLSLHVNDGATIADVTYGKGVFWRKVPKGAYDLKATDIDPEKSPTGESVDCRDLPYGDDEFDALVLDPPYTSGFYTEVNQKASNGGEYGAFRDAYTSDGTSWDDELHPEAQKVRKRHARVLDVYYKSIEEAWRVLNDTGTLIVKCQDEVSDNLNYMTHIEIAEFCESVGFTLVDLFVLVRSNTVRTPHENQNAALKNHSYFLVFDVEGGSLRD